MSQLERCRGCCDKEIVAFVVGIVVGMMIVAAVLLAAGGLR